MHDLIVVSDLHLGRGKNPESGRYHNLEAFFYDDDFRRFCRYLCQEAERRATPFKLIFNGDVFDLLRIEPPAAESDDAPRRERRFGPALTPTVASQLVQQILAGHEQFVLALAEVLVAGYEIVFLPGNHDIELQWPPVELAVRRAIGAQIAALAEPALAEPAAARLMFAPWFYYEPGRIWIEHGCQYDAESSFRYPLRGGLAAHTDAASETEADLPLGSFIQRYLYNAFGPITFIVPSTRANLRYVKWLLMNRPRMLLRALASHGPFAWQLLRRISSHARELKERLRRWHEDELKMLAEQSGLHETLTAIDHLKDVRHDLVQTVRTLSWQLLRVSAAGLVVAFATAGLWFAGFHSINQLRLGFGPKALLFLALNFLLLIATTAGVGYALIRDQPETVTPSLLRAAGQIARLLGVPIVTFGHTHDEALWRLVDVASHKAWYFNTGTWIAVFAHEDLLPREVVQFTFLRVHEREGELLHWSPGRGEPLPVILLDEESAGVTIHRGASEP